MELTGKDWENYYTDNVVKNKESDIHKRYLPELLNINTYSLGELIERVLWMKDIADANNKDPYAIPVLLEEGTNLYTFFGCSSGTAYNTFRFNKGDKLCYIAPDVKPTEGEYWESRGPSNDDCAGFIKSKKAGERLNRLVSYLVDKEKPDSYMDFREHEPDYIQYKFAATEFDLNKLHELSKNNNNIITQKILEDCKIC